MLSNFMNVSAFKKISSISSNQQNIHVSNNLPDLYIKEVTDLIASGKMLDPTKEIVPEGKHRVRFVWPTHDLEIIESAYRVCLRISSEFSDTQKDGLKKEIYKLYPKEIHFTEEYLTSAIFFKSLISPRQLSDTYNNKSTHTKLEINIESAWGNIIELYNQGHIFEKHQGKKLVIKKDPILYKYFAQLADKNGITPKKPETLQQTKTEIRFSPSIPKFQFQNVNSSSFNSSLTPVQYFRYFPMQPMVPVVKSVIIDHIDNKKRKSVPDDTQEPVIKKTEKLNPDEVIDLIKFCLEDVKNDISKINWKWIAQDKEKNIEPIKAIWENYLRELESKVTDKNSMSRLRKLVSMRSKETKIDWEWVKKSPGNSSIQKTAEEWNLEWQQSVVNASIEFSENK